MITVPAKTLDDLRNESARSGLSVLHLTCVYPVWSRFIGEVIATGVDVNKPFDNGSLPLIIAITNGNLVVARALVAAGANPASIGKGGRGVLHNAIYYDSSKIAEIVDVVKYAIELCPYGINHMDDRHKTPLQVALDIDAPLEVISLLLASGCSVRVLTESERKSWHIPLLIAYGYRFIIVNENPSKRSRKEGPAPWEMIQATEQCRSVVRAILGLTRVKGRILGNGRDVLRLVAKEAWLSRMDERWMNRERTQTTKTTKKKIK